MDLVALTARLPSPGETVRGDSFRMTPGGKGANQAVAGQRLGAAAVMVGCVGSDLFGASLLDGLRGAGVDTRHVRVIDERPSGVALIGVDANGENAITVVAGANAALSPDAALPPIQDGVHAVLVQLEIPFETAAAALARARERGILTVLDPAPAPSRPFPAGLFEVDVATPNQSEAEAITGIRVDSESSARAAAGVLHTLGVGTVILTMGERGVYVSGERFYAVPAFRVDAIDTTASGDAFAAAIAVALAEGQPEEEAVRWAAAAGALAATRRGAQEAMPTRADVDRLTRGGRAQHGHARR